ncbi:XRE family transcriptional regulator [Hymenobacter gummosus]|uniref:XRE family transcriptional regulator n=1 Tax=Hymenobacter gummosus TaxID=1776032 RepID=A0A3S0ILD6_9BACT|nr:helix-turn-helix transcriptional regulator [Hymenobacter gummosus]RTQ47508.1 XRE family transcriptional regulator [Hymenobacter gummosus]
MPSDSTTLAAAVRRHFALSQQELARYLGLTRTQVANVETGRTNFSAAAERRLLHLAELLAPPHGGGPPLPPAADPAAPDPDPLRQRLRRCRHLAGQARFELHGLRQRLPAGEYRRRALAQLRAALLPPTPPPGVPDPTFDAAHAAHWLARLDADTAAALPDAAGYAQLALLEVRLSALEHEAGLLAALLAE